MARLQVQKKDKTLILKALGRWEIGTIASVDQELRNLNLSNLKVCTLETKNIERLDTAGAWILYRFMQRAKEASIVMGHYNPHPSLVSLFKRFPKEIKDVAYKEEVLPPFQRAAYYMGWRTMLGCERAMKLLFFLGEATVRFYKNLFETRDFRYMSMISILERVGFRALPIVGIMSVLIGGVMIYQAVFQLQRFGAEIFAIDMLAISLSREISILMTAVIVAGRSGSAFAAQIGTMKLNQEIDALRVLGMNPIEILVLPRVVALTIALPILAFYSLVLGLFGGYVMSVFSLGMSLSQYLMQLNQALTMDSFIVGMIKAPFFALIIALVGCFEGMQVSGGAESVGNRTTRSVVEAIFLVILFNAFFSVVFTGMGL